MCLITLAYRTNNQYPIILSSNRDEYLARPTQQAHFWNDHPNILAGRDLEGMGTWLAVTRTGRFAAVTNYRDTTFKAPKQPRSRGLLISDFLQQSISPEVYLKKLKKTRDAYSGYNLILGDLSSVWYYSNVQNHIQTLSPGMYGLSNHFLDTPWPKVNRAKTFMKQCIQENKRELNDLQQCLFTSLLDGQTASDDELPNTGVRYDLEKRLSSIYIDLEHYGTRAATVMTMSKEKHVHFVEHTMRHGKITHKKNVHFIMSH